MRRGSSRVFRYLECGRVRRSFRPVPTAMVDRQQGEPSLAELCEDRYPVSPPGKTFERPGDIRAVVREPRNRAVESLIRPPFAPLGLLRFRPLFVRES